MENGKERPKEEKYAKETTRTKEEKKKDPNTGLVLTPKYSGREV